MSVAPRIQDLPTVFREKATQVRQDAAAEQAATAWERAAEIAEEVLSGSDMEPLTLEESEVLGGYTRRHLARLIREEVLPNAGSPGDPRLYRCHVPIKPGHRVAREPAPPSSRSKIARSIAERDRR